MQYCFKITGEYFKKDKSGNILIVKELNNTVQYSFVVLALKLGYNSNKIWELANIYLNKRFILARVKIDLEIQLFFIFNEFNKNL